jgi:hypothetical protein
MVTGTVTPGGSNCTPLPDRTYQPMVASVASKKTATVLDLTGGKFCCFNMACPATFSCDEEYTFTVVSSAGTLTQMAPTHLDLDACTEICAP